MSSLYSETYLKGTSLDKPLSTLVLGLGSTGEDTAKVLSRYMPEGVSSVRVYGGLSAQESAITEALRSMGCELVLGTEDVEGSYDLAISSPGIPESVPFRAKAAACSKEMISEPELAWRMSPDGWVAITGTNGKTTTTSLTKELFCAGGLVAATVGNIGQTCISRVVEREPNEWLIAELSSFQLAGTSDFHPHVAALLNITPDHIEWHGSFANYVDAKLRMFKNMDANDLAIVSVDDEICAELAEKLSAQGLRVLRLTRYDDPGTFDTAFVRDEMLYLRFEGTEIKLIRAEELQIRGKHNLANALAAASCAVFAGASIEGIQAGLRAFKALEHRIEAAGVVDGVSYINDSKATNVDSTEKALTAFEPGTIVLLLGGHDKGTSLEELARAIQASCKAVICYGEARDRFMADLGAVAQAGVELLGAQHMADALESASKLAAPGDTVLLSPACSSYDEFDNYEQRGQAFKELVAAMRSGTE